MFHTKNTFEKVGVLHETNDFPMDNSGTLVAYDAHRFCGGHLSVLGCFEGGSMWSRAL